MVAVETIWAVDGKHWLYMKTRNQDILFQITDSKNICTHMLFNVFWNAPGNVSNYSAKI